MLGFCVKGVVSVEDCVSSFLANLQLGLGELAGHWLGVSRAAVHWLGVSQAGGPPKQDSPRKASFLPSTAILLSRWKLSYSAFC